MIVEFIRQLFIQQCNHLFFYVDLNREVIDYSNIITKNEGVSTKFRSERLFAKSFSGQMAEIFSHTVYKILVKHL